MSKIVDFVHLHCHSEFSTLDGLPKVEDYVIKSAELGFPALALTEHGNMRSMIQLYKKCQSNFDYGGDKHTFDPIKPIMGIEFYLSPNNYKIKGLPESMKNKIRRETENKTEANKLIREQENKYGIRKRFHMLAFAKNNNGLKNLLMMNYLSWKYGFYYRPRIDFDLIKKYHEDIIITTTCIGGIVPMFIRNERDDVAFKYLKKMKKIFKDDLYVELQPHNIDEQKQVNKVIVGMADDLKIKTVATNDCHYLLKDDYDAHNMLLDINSGSKSRTAAGDKWRFGDTGFYLRTKDEMYKAFRKHHKFLSDERINESLENTVEIADKCNVEFKLDKKQAILPKVKLPDEYESVNKYLIDLCRKGWKWRDISDKIKKYAEFKGISIKKSKKIYKERLKLELSRIMKLKFTKYFLIIQDLINYARENDIEIGTRGSVGGSFACYLLGITSIDPIRYDILFDRFLSEYRMDYPDIDIDIEDEKRKYIFTYLFKKYGEKNVCMVSTIDRMKGKQALQDVSRVKGIPMWEVTEVTKHIVLRPEGDARSSQTVEDSFNEFEISKNFNKKYPDVLPYVKKLESKARHVGIHAAAIQIAPFKLNKYIPLEFRDDKRLEKKVQVSALDWRDCQELGLLKIDLLGLKTLTSLKFAINEIKKRHNVSIDRERIDLEDKKVLENFTKGNFAGIFQFDSIGMRKTCEKLNFDNFEDIIAMNALYRPGSMRVGAGKDYIARKVGEQKIKKKHPLYDKITKNTYGIVIYQEQLMQVFMYVAGYQPSKADIVRKKVAKSSGTEAIWKEREDFMAGAKKNNVSEKLANKLFKDMSFFGSYAFNKAHAAQYSMHSYVGMYLKTYYSTEFFYGLLKKESVDDHISNYIKEAKRLGIKIVLPDVNISAVNFSIIKDKVISVGLVDVKGIGEKASESIVENQPYTDMYDFLQKVDRRRVNKGVISALIRVGAFKSLYPNTGALLKNKSIERIKKNGESEVIEKSLWEWMLDMRRDEIETSYKLNDKPDNKLKKEHEQRIISEVSPIPPDKHIIKYYKKIDKYVKANKHFNLVKINNIDMNEPKFILKGIIVDIKYNQIGDFYKEPPDDEEKKRIGWGRRYVSMNIDDGTDIRRMKVDADVFSSFRHIIDKGLDTPVMVAVRPFAKFNILFVDVAVDLDHMREIIENKNLSIKKKYKKLNCFEKYLIKHPVTFYNKKLKTRIKKINKPKVVGRFKIVGLVVKVKYHWTKTGNKMAFIEIEDETGLISIVVWSDILNKNIKKLKIGNVIKAYVIKKDKNSCFFDNKSKITFIKQSLNYI